MEETVRVSILGQVQAELRDFVIATVQEAVAAQTTDLGTRIDQAIFKVSSNEAAMEAAIVKIESNTGTIL